MRRSRCADGIGGRCGLRCGCRHGNGRARRRARPLGLAPAAPGPPSSTAAIALSPKVPAASVRGA